MGSYRRASFAEKHVWTAWEMCVEDTIYIYMVIALRILQACKAEKS